MGNYANGVMDDVVEWVKKNRSGMVILREWRICLESEIEDPRRGRSVVRWKDRVKEYMHDRGTDREEGLNKQGGSVWIAREMEALLMRP